MIKYLYSILFTLFGVLSFTISYAALPSPNCSLVPNGNRVDVNCYGMNYNNFAHGSYQKGGDTYTGSSLCVVGSPTDSR